MQQKRFVSSLSTALVAVVLLAASAPALAQEGGHPEMTPDEMAMMEKLMAAGTPGAPHAALAASAGTYKLAIKSWQDPAMPPMESSGTAQRSMMLDGRVRVESVESSMMGMPFTGHGMMGYDNVSKKYWSTWTDSMSTGVMVSDGTCDDKHACAYTGSWNDPITGGVITARMHSRWSTPTTEVFEMYAPGPDGKEMKMMEITYTKQ